MVLRARSRLGVNAPTLGFLVDLLEDGYQSAVADGVLKAAKNAGAAVLCFVGGIVGSPARSAMQRNHVFELATPTTVDGLVVLGGTLVNHVGVVELTKYCERYRPIPICSVGEALTGMPNVLIDNEVGMRSIVEHLLVSHRYKRIAFVRGPLANAEAELRFQVYRDVLSRHGIAFDERLVMVGNFQAESGRAAVAALLGERGIGIQEIDAIVASNDNMAFGVLDALKERGIRVPSDVAVTGFDDVEEARYANPRLTTVCQPLEEQGREAVRMVLVALQHKTTPGNVLLRTELVVRESCGCSVGIEQQPTLSNGGISLGFEASLVSRRQHMLAELTRAARGSMGHAGANWEARLVTAVADDLRGEESGASARLFEGFIEGAIERRLDIAVSHKVLDCLRREILACLRREPERCAKAEDLFQDLRITIGRTVERLLGASRLRLECWARQLSSVGAHLIGTFDVGDLRKAIAENFPRLGIESCFVATYEADAVPSKFSNLVLAYDRRLDSPEREETRFSTDELLPMEVIGRSNALRNYVVAPLFFKQEILGYLVIEFDFVQTFAYEAIRDLVSAALKGAMLVRDVLQQKNELDSAARLIGEDQARHAACLDQLQRVRGDLAEGSLSDPSEICGRITRLLEGQQRGSPPR
jgi:phosphoserine phosphatase RsbU/P